MSAGLAYIVEARADMPALRDLIEELRPLRVQVSNPWNDRITALDPEGEQIELSESGLADMLQQESDVTFQWWYEHVAHTDIICTIRRHGSSMVVQEYTFGSSHDEHVRVDAWAVDRFARHARLGRMLMMFVDYEEIHEAGDWDAFALGDAMTPRWWPYLIGFSKGHPATPAITPEGYEREETDAYVLLTHVSRLDDGRPAGDTGHEGPGRAS